MSQKIAVAIVHGIGLVDPTFADGMIAELKERLADRLGSVTPDPRGDFVFQPVLWAPVLQGSEDNLVNRLKTSNPWGYATLRRFMIDFAADALAYQPVPGDRGVYDGIHAIVAKAVKTLSQKAGPEAPLCFIAHSLGTVITSNYLYDLQVYPRRKLIAAPVRRAMGCTPIDKGETLAALYTMGSPLALWSLRYDDFGTPITVPSPKLNGHYPTVQGEWINFYDSSDIIGYPLKSINDAYGKRVTADKAVNVGNLLTSWNPASHLEYWTDNDVTIPIADGLARLWRQSNGH